MKTYNSTENKPNRMWGGLVILIIGLVFLSRNFGLYVPHWIFSWHTIILVIGLFIGFKRNFTFGPWLFFVIIGGYATLANITSIDLFKYFFSLTFIITGLFMIFRPKMAERNNRKKKAADFSTVEGMEAAGETFGENDFVESVNVFGGSKQVVFSKNFKGGEVTSIFGGCEINMTQADFQDMVTLEVTAVFGGAKIIIPPGWEVKSEITAVFGGVEDKRTIIPMVDGPRKIIRITGVALFGGINITNY